MAIARINGPMLNSNLERQGVNLAIDANLMYYDVTDRFVGINNTTPGYALDSTGNARIANLFVLGNQISSNTGKVSLGSISNVTISGGSANYILYTDGAGNLSFGNLAALTGLEGFTGNNISLGTNTQGSLVSNAVTLTTATTITNAIAEINQALGSITTGNGNIQVSGNIVASNLTVTNNATVDGNVNILGNATIANFISGKIQSGSVTIPASSNIIYVAKNGNDSNDGTINSPFLTIAAAVSSISTAQPSRGGLAIHVAPGLYTENNPITLPNNVSLIGDTLRGVAITPANPNQDIFYLSGGPWVWGLTVQNYSANAFAYSPSMSNMNFYTSPYIQNVTSISTSPNACAVMIDGNYVGSGGTKAMIVGFYTIINQGGYGVCLKNNAYAQLVNIYTIATNVGIWSDTGSFCTLNGSDNSIGNIGLQATNYGPLATSGNTVGYSQNGTFTITNMASQPHVNQVVIISGDANFYSINSITKVDAITYTITIPETYTANLVPGTNVSFYQRSEVVASAHTFEYVGSGTNMMTALPQYGGIPNANLNVVTSNGGRVTYTATDEKGNFWIGSNLVINQGTGTISGTAFDRSLFALMTPYILALETALT